MPYQQPIAAESAPVEAQGIPELTPEQLEKYQFENPAAKDNARISELSVGQVYTLNRQRRDLEALMVRQLGIMKFKGNPDDLKSLQLLVKNKVVKTSDIGTWQAMGVVFGDILANELDLHWVSYEDELGISKALRWRKTDNFLFPVTMFSKRVQFNEKIDAFALYDSVKADVAAFKAYDRIHGEI